MINLTTHAPTCDNHSQLLKAFNQLYTVKMLRSRLMHLGLYSKLVSVCVSMCKKICPNAK